MNHEHLVKLSFQCYVTAVVSKFLVKPKFNFPENESAVLCLVLDVRTNSFLLRLCSIKRKSIIWEQEIETKMHIKNKNNLILLDATVKKLKINLNLKFSLQKNLNFTDRKN